MQPQTTHAYSQSQQKQTHYGLAAQRPPHYPSSKTRDMIPQAALDQDEYYDEELDYGDEEYYDEEVDGMFDEEE